ncbi:NADH:flavin oxidoreductase/NADH oxidase [Rickenella mellea]|uniref:NADH:flavin oxidoreductase/NADH oxidase n=1 Tax=Rickenella mellea TaxID=50990 RepID=A0A4Y7PUE3_9AGAM|nr:NADH:flavin oxidoreductase/NADH oxidase [Rickenella mellea]
MTWSKAKLFEPIRVGDMTLQHRVALAPLTRSRANSAHAHGDLAVEYYSQRASAPGTLLITEATFIAGKAGLYANTPGVYTDDQIAGWKRVTDAVHAKGSYIFLQMWALGRTANTTQLRKEHPGAPFTSASDIKLSGRDEAPRPMTIAEIEEFVQLFTTAASRAVNEAGFDGVEIHGANGYLIDQFLQDVSNKRTDEYGGSIENRVRFPLEVIDAVTKAIGPKKTGIRMSPWSKFQDMRMKDPLPTFSHYVTRVRDSHPDLAYIHLVEPQVYGGSDDPNSVPSDSNDFIREIWGERPLLVAGGASTPEGVLDLAERTGNIIAIGRYFISNPDLPTRIKKGIPWNPYNRKTFYLPESPEGYIDQPFAEDETARL